MSTKKFTKNNILNFFSSASRTVENKAVETCARKKKDRLDKAVYRTTPAPDSRLSVDIASKKTEIERR